MGDTATVYAFPGVGDSPGERPPTFEEYLVSIGLSRNTIRAYASRVEQAQRAVAKMGVTLDTANARHLAALAASGPDSHAFRAQLRCALKHYYEWRDRMDAPVRAVRVPPQPRMVCKAIEPDEIRALVKVAVGWWPHGTVVLMGLYLGLRRFEIAKAEWDRFDSRMEWYRVTGKRDKTATLPVHPTLAGELAPHRRPRGYVFPGRKNVRDHVAPATVWAWTRRVFEGAGLEPQPPHVLRHTALTTALDNTQNLRSVMEFARHERPETTAGYTRTTKAQLKAVAEALDYF